MYIDYYKYIESKEWKEKRKEMLKLFDPICFRCGSNNNLNLHHKSYKNLGKETSNDLIVLCNSCHGKLHQIEKILECGLEITTIVFLRTCRRNIDGSPKRPNKERRNKFIYIGKCRKCGNDLKLVEPKKRKFKKNQPYYFTHYWKCESCNTRYMDDKFKVMIKNNL